ncbi:DUF4238 domain-containing protein [Thalassotalea nanhaiensis]|uniref:DUF4238 domain-containing protein n=1 Tax=Thalassotalea nanhaiensis TaxID=3065648 RepID=A0ABY9TMD0_9GAMM|nr:DUF4238 domain-containing protein [Colwelliaceae bacterium SQ345]
MTARHHHYLSQCYLKGFTKGQTKKSKLSVIDFKQKKSFETKPRNVGGIRDFNRIDLEGVDQNAIETELSKFEGHAATALNRLKNSLDFSGETKDLVLNLIALIAIRSPERREHMRKFHAQLADVIMGMTLDSKERWESQVGQLKKTDPSYKNEVTYDQAKEFFDKKQYEIEVARERHIQIEMVQIDAILPLLHGRKWLLLVANEKTGPFITTDQPVNLSWKNPDEVPSPYRSSPGFGLKSTEVYFPISQNLALLGEFDGREGVVEAPKHLVAVFNTKMLYNFYSQLYSPKIDFTFFGKDDDLMSGKLLLKEFST